MDSALGRVLARGVADGIVSPAQRDALLALAAADADDSTDARRGALDAVSVAYALGAALVVAALAWFLADRWAILGPAGVLAVAAGYAALFAAAAARLARARFPLAAGVATALAAITAPLAAWALLRLAGEWPDERWGGPLTAYEPYIATRRLVVELTGVLAVLLCLRFVPRNVVRRTPLAVPLAVAAGLALAECATLVAIAAADVDLLWAMRGWAHGAAGALAFGLAYETDRRQPPPGDPAREDFAGWLYLAACFAFQTGLIGVVGEARWSHHALPLVALAQLAAAVRLRRRVLLAAGMGNAIWYLGHLAFDVFDDVLGFPFLLAAFGAAVLGVTVVVQRRYPALVRRAPADGVVPRLPGGALAAWAPAAVAVAVLVVAVPRARARADARAADEARHARPLPPPPGRR